MMTYNEYINNILNTRGRFACGDEYHERHHVTPRCMGGKDDDENLIDLYAREHYEAHKLLAEENPDNDKILFAWWSMSMKSSITGNRYQLTAEEYESAKVALSIAQSRTKKEIFKNKENHPMYGRHFSEESKMKMRQSHLGKQLTEEHKRHISESLSGKNNPCYGKPKTKEQKHKQSIAIKGRYANGNSVCCVPIYCPELDESFWGLQEACDKYGFTKPNISKCLKGERKHSGRHPVTGEKLTWRYLENN